MTISPFCHGLLGHAVRALLAVAALGVGGVAQAQDPGTTPLRTAADDVFGGTPELPTVIRGSGLMVMPMGTIDDLTLVVGEPPHQQEVADKFKSTYPNLLRYSAVSSNMAAATVSVSGSVVTVTPVAPGMTTVTVTATNGTNSAQQEFSVTARNPRLDAPRRVGRLDDVTLAKGQPPHPVAVENAFSGDLLVYSAVSSNPGVATVSVSGSVVTVTPIAVGMTTVTVTAQNGGGDADQTFTVTVRERAAPSAVGSLDDLELVVGQPAHPVEVADAFAGDDLTYSAVSTTLGVALVTTSGSVVSVSPLSVGMTTVTVTAQNDLGQATQTFDVTVRNPNAPQAAGSLADITLVLGQPPHDVEVAGAFTGEYLQFTPASSNSGVASVTVSGSVVTVTPVSAGETTVMVIARNSAGQVTQTFDVTVRNPGAPQAVGSLADLELEVGEPPHDVEVARAFSGDYLDFTAASSNPGAASVTVSGSVVSVTPVSAGAATVTVTATNSAGSATQTFDVTVRNPGAPQAVGSLDDLELVLGQPPHPVQVARAFTGDYLEFTAASSSPGVASVVVAGSVVTVTPESLGMTTVTVTAANSGGTATQTFDVTVRNPDAPQAVGTLDDLELELGEPPHPVQVARAFTGDYLEFTAVSSNPGIASVVVSGSVVAVTPVALGMTTVTVTASNSGGTATQTFDVTVRNPGAPRPVGSLDDLDLVLGQPPHLVRVGNAFEGRFLEYTAASSNPGVAPVTVTGSVVTVTPESLGMTTVTVTAQNDGGQATQTFEVTVRNPNAPRAVGTLDDVTLVLGQPPHTVGVASAFEGEFLTYTADSSNPGFATVEIAGTVVTVTPVAVGATTVTVTASNSVGQATQTFTVTVRDSKPRGVGSLDDLELVLGQPPHDVEVADAFAGMDLTYAAESSEPGLAAVAISGSVVTVTAVAVGTATVTVTASNSVGQATQTFTVTVRDSKPRGVGSLDDLELVLGQPPHDVEVADAFAGMDLTYAAESSDPAVAAVAISGSVVTVTPVTVGTATVTVTARNDAGEATQTFEVTVKDVAPAAVGRLDDVTLLAEQPPHDVEVAGAFTGTNLTYAAVSSDPSVTLTVTGAVVTLTPASVGAASVTVTARNSAGEATQTFEVTVKDVAPAAVGRLDDVTLLVEQPPHDVEVAGAFTGTNLTYAAVSFDPSVTVTVTGSVVTLTPASVGTATVTVTARNTAGEATQTFGVTVLDVAPAVLRRLDDLTLVVGQPPHEVDLTGAFGGTNLTYAAESSGPAVARVAAGVGVVTVAPVVEGVVTVTVTARNSAGEAAQTFTVTVTTDAAEADLIDDILAAMGRNTLASVRGAITGRFRSAPGRTPGAAARSAGGAALGFSTFRGAAGAAAGGLTAGTVFGAGGLAGPGGVSRGAPLGAPAAGGGGGAGTSRLDPLLWGHDFLLPLGGGGAAAQADGEAPSTTGAVWGSTDMQWFRGTPEAGRYDGAVKSVYLGVDGRVSDAWTGGVTAALTRASGDYVFASERASGEGSLHTSLNSLYPYVRWTSAAGDEVWGAFGGGVGNARHTRPGAAGSTSASYRLLLGTAGWRRGLVRGDGLRVSTVGDLGIVHLKTQGTVGPLARRRLSVQQVRAGVEAEYAGRQVRPFVQASGRADGGAGQTGAGIEVAGGVRYGLPSGWAVEALARTMALHSADGYREHGASVTARYAASPDGLGLSLALSPRWGAGAQGGGVEALWRDQALQRTLYGMPVQQSAIDGAVGYGIAAPRLGGLLTAFGEFDVGAGQRARSGIRLNLAERAIQALDMEVSAARQNFPGFDTDNRIDVLGRLSF